MNWSARRQRSWAVPWSETKCRISTNTQSCCTHDVTLGLALGVTTRTAPAISNCACLRRLAKTNWTENNKIVEKNASATEHLPCSLPRKLENIRAG